MPDTEGAKQGGILSRRRSPVGMKAEKVEQYLEGCRGRAWPAHYLGYFECFAGQMYYEAHDVLEELWMDNGREHPNHAFYKGLIQATGAFVHMKLQYEHPTHRIHGKRLAPAVRLFKLAFENLGRYGDRHDGLDVAAFLAMCREFHDPLVASNETVNPWSPDRAPDPPRPEEPAGS